MGVLLTLVVLVLAVQNTESAHLEFLGWDANAPLVAVLLGSALVGVVFDEIAGLLWRHHRRRQIAERQELATRRAATIKPIDESGAPVSALTDQPIPPPHSADEVST